VEHLRQNLAGAEAAAWWAAAGWWSESARTEAAGAEPPGRLCSDEGRQFGPGDGPVLVRVGVIEEAGQPLISHLFSGQLAILIGVEAHHAAHGVVVRLAASVAAGPLREHETAGDHADAQ
jgi:hypothetical protein